ncbi:MAG: YaaC family protein [Candidatus Gastranaerophilales bacterium]|nr:YaaC family protein [Candidatus Gastranaerophilales bacterium]
MRTIITSDIEFECQNMISNFLDVNFIKTKITDVFPNLSEENLKSVSNDIHFYANQGMELYFVSDTSINTIPLTLFYSLNNFVKAAYLLRFPNLELDTSHGVTICSTGLKTCNELGEIKVQFSSSGTFKNLMELTNDDIDLSRTLLMKDLFSVIPELSALYALVYSEEARVYLLQGKKDCISEYSVLFQTNNANKISRRDDSLLKQNGYNLEIERHCNGINGYLWLNANSFGKENNVIYFDSYGNKYCTTGIKSGQNIIKVSKISSLYICYYVFSMLVRYHPRIWMKFCDTKEVSIMKKLLTNMRDTVLVEVLQLLTGENYIFTTHIAEQDKDLDYSEILKNLLKEIDEENRRCGKSILWPYI